MDIEDAFCSVEHLASRHRLLIGRGYRSEQREFPEIDWSAGDVRDIRNLRGFEFLSEIGPTLLEIHDDYVAGTSRTVTSITWTRTAVTFIVRGVESPGQIAEMLCDGAGELISQHVMIYLTERLSDWKRPRARVLPFRKRTPD